MDTIEVNGKTFRLIVQYKKNRYTYLRIHNRNTLVIYTNHRTQPQMIRDFIAKNSTKILNYVDQQPQKIHPIFSDLLFFQGQFYPVIYQSSLKTLWDWDGKTLSIQSQNIHRKAILDFYQSMTINEAKHLIDVWSSRLLPFISLSNVTLKAQLMTSQFGSCQTEKRIIKLNSILSCFDPQYLEIIFLHEAMHLKVSNHGSDFYQLLLHYSPDYRQKRKELGWLFRSIEVS